MTHSKYLAIVLDQHFLWDQYLNMLKQKLNRTSGLLAKARYYLFFPLLRCQRNKACEINCKVFGKL